MTQEKEKCSTSEATSNLKAFSGRKRHSSLGKFRLQLVKHRRAQPLSKKILDAQYMYFRLDSKK